MEEEITRKSIAFKPETLAQLDELTEKLSSPSRSDTVRRTIELAVTLAKVIGVGGEVLIESKNRTKRVSMPGLKTKAKSWWRR